MRACVRARACVTVVLRVRQKIWAKAVWGEAARRTACVRGAAGRLQCCGGVGHFAAAPNAINSRYSKHGFVDAVETPLRVRQGDRHKPSQNGVRSNRTAG